MEPNNHSQHPLSIPGQGQISSVSGPSPVPPTEVLTVAAVAVELDQRSGAPARTRGDYDRHLVPAQTEHAERVSTQTKPGTGTRLAIAAVVLLLILGAGFGISYILRLHHEAIVKEQTSDLAMATPVVDVLSVEPVAARYPFALPGETAGWYQSTIFSRVDGYVGRWWSDIGDHVKQGQVLATVETPELDQQLNAAKAKVQSSAAEVNVAKTQVSIAKVTYDRWWGSPKGVVAEQDKQEKEADYKSAQAKLAAAEAQMQLDQAGVERLNAFEGFKKVTAPYNGVITKRYIDIGVLVTAGSTANTSPVYDIADTDTIRVFVNVPQKAAADMTIGVPAKVTCDQFPGHVFEGKVARSSRSIDPQSLTQRTEVDIPNDNPKEPQLVPGMTVDVTFELNQSGLLEVPASAVLFRPSGLQVAVVDARGKLHFHHIVVAKDDGQVLEISSGVEPRDRVAINLSSEIGEGEKVQPVEVEESNAVPAAPAPAVETTGPPHQGNAPPNYVPQPNSGMHPPFPTSAPAHHLGASEPVPSGEPSPAPQTGPTDVHVNQPGAGVGGVGHP